MYWTKYDGVVQQVFSLGVNLTLSLIKGTLFVFGLTPIFCRAQIVEVKDLPKNLVGINLLS